MGLDRVPALGLTAGLAGLVALGAAQPLTPASARPAASASADARAQITADVLTADNLRYLGLRSVSTGSGSVDVLQFAFDAATGSNLLVRTACADGWQLRESASASASLTSSSIDATSLSAVVGGISVTYTAAAPPVDPFPATVELHDLTIDVTTLAADRIALPAASVRAVAC